MFFSHKSLKIRSTRIVPVFPCRIPTERPLAIPPSFPSLLSWCSTEGTSSRATLSSEKTSASSTEWTRISSGSGSPLPSRTAVWARSATWRRLNLRVANDHDRDQIFRLDCSCVGRVYWVGLKGLNVLLSRTQAKQLSKSRKKILATT